MITTSSPPSSAPVDMPQPAAPAGINFTNDFECIRKL